MYSLVAVFSLMRFEFSVVLGCVVAEPFFGLPCNNWDGMLNQKFLASTIYLRDSKEYQGTSIFCRRQKRSGMA